MAWNYNDDNKNYDPNTYSTIKIDNRKYKLRDVANCINAKCVDCSNNRLTMLPGTIGK